MTPPLLAIIALFFYVRMSAAFVHVDTSAKPVPQVYIKFNEFEEGWARYERESEITAAVLCVCVVIACTVHRRIPYIVPALFDFRVFPFHSAKIYPCQLPSAPIHFPVWIMTYLF